jgi:hypothetical protein
MTSKVRTITKIILLVALAALARPVSATITYTACSSGCSSTSGTYAAWQTAPGSAGLTFSSLPVTFTGSNLASGVYTDPTGTVFTGYNGANPDNLSVSGTALVQTVTGFGAGIQFTLPANTYALAFTITNLLGASGQPMVALNNLNLSAANYTIVIPNGSSPQFFGIISDTAISSIFVGNLNGGGTLQINDFKLGQSSPTPEASSAVLIGGGLVLVGVLRRRVHEPDRALA